MRTRSRRKRQPSPGEDAQQLETRAIRILWTTDEETELLNFLQDRRHRMILGAMFADRMFDQAAEYIEIFRRRGAAKTGPMCKAKWVRLKRTHKLISLLKSKCGTAFEWDDEIGMGVTAERQAEWNNLVKGNKGFEAFANKGWPHCEAMQILMSTRAEDKDTYRGTRPTIHISEKVLQALGPVPSSISSSSNHKRESRLFDDAAISETSSSMSQRCLLKKLVARAMSVPAPAPGLVSAPVVTYDSYQIEAVQELIQSVEKSKWLSEDNTIRIINLFKKDLDAAVLYVELRGALGAPESYSRPFIMRRLKEMDAEA